MVLRFWDRRVGLFWDVGEPGALSLSYMGNPVAGVFEIKTIGLTELATSMEAKVTNYISCLTRGGAQKHFKHAALFPHKASR